MDGVFWERNSLTEQKSKSNSSFSSHAKRGRKRTKNVEVAEIKVDEERTLFDFGESENV